MSRIKAVGKNSKKGDAMKDFTCDISEEQLAAYLEGKDSFEDIDFLNYVVNDIGFAETIDTILEIDDTIDEITECLDYNENIV